MYLSKCKPNQFGDSYSPRRLCNWEIPRSEFCRSKPTELTDCRRCGFTRIIANDKGHLFSTVKKGKGGPWSDYVNSFDLPPKIPGPKTNIPTARTKKQARILKEKYDEFHAEICSRRGKKTAESSKECVTCQKIVLGKGEPHAVKCKCYKDKQPAMEGPCATTKKDPCSTIKTDPCSTTKADPCSTTKTDPCSTTKADPCSTTETEPCSTTKTDPCSTTKADPCSTTKTDPCSTIRTDPCSSTKAEPCSTIRTDPCSTTETECPKDCEKPADKTDDNCLPVTNF